MQVRMATGCCAEPVPLAHLVPVLVSVAQSCPALRNPHGQQPARLGPLPMGFFRRECWRGKPFSPPGDLPDPCIGARSSALEEDSSPAEPPLPTVLTSVPAVDMGDPEVESFKKILSFLH